MKSPFAGYELEKDTFYKVTYYFLSQYFNWEATFTRHVLGDDTITYEDEQKLFESLRQIQYKLTADSDIFFKMMLKIAKKVNASEERSNEITSNAVKLAVPDYIEKMSDIMDAVHEVYTMVFLRLFSYFKDEK